MMKTRSGDSVGLLEVLEEAVERAARRRGRTPKASPTKRRQDIAEIVGIGAVKYRGASASTA